MNPNKNAPDTQQMLDALPHGDITAVVLHFNDRFDRHVSQEMERYDDIKDLIDQQINASQVRHEETGRRIDALLQSVVALRADEKSYHASPCPHLLDAFPEGDINGHRNAHTSMMKAAEDMRELVKHIKKVVITSAVVGVGTWVLMNMWHVFLAGPK